jgi:hypothetical protein
MGPLGTEAVCRLGLQLGWCGHMFGVSLVNNFQILIALYFDIQI